MSFRVIRKGRKGAPRGMDRGETRGIISHARARARGSLWFFFSFALSSPGAVEEIISAERR